jgi:signal transduction histidine kinase
VGIAVELVLRLVRDPKALRRVGLGVLIADTLITLGFVWVFAFDRFSAQWALLTILPLEGALRFQAAGAIGVWAVVAPVYILRDVYASVVHEVPLSEGTVAYRLGLLLVIALFAGASARELEVQRRGLAGLADAQRRIAALLEPAEILRALCREAVVCLRARSAVVYVHDGTWFQPVAAWPADALPGVMAEDDGEVEDPALGERVIEGLVLLTADRVHPPRLCVPLRWRQHPAHILAVRTPQRRSDELWVGIAGSLAEPAVVALATTEVLTAEERSSRRLRYLEALRTRFVATVAHDLRRPLTIFKGVSALLRKRRDDIAPGEIDEMLRNVERQANRLSRLADDLLDGARLEADRLVLQPMPCDLATVIAGAVADPARSRTWRRSCRWRPTATCGSWRTPGVWTGCCGTCCRTPRNTASPRSRCMPGRTRIPPSCISRCATTAPASTPPSARRRSTSSRPPTTSQASDLVWRSCGSSCPRTAGASATRTRTPAPASWSPSLRTALRRSARNDGVSELVPKAHPKPPYWTMETADSHVDISPKRPTCCNSPSNPQGGEGMVKTAAYRLFLALASLMSIAAVLGAPNKWG